MTGEQIRAGRNLLGWTATELGKRAGISYPTVQRLDATRGPVGGTVATVDAVRTALEGGGVQFLNAGETARGTGVCMRDPKIDLNSIGEVIE